jgi:hypothetical protein
MAGIPSLKMVKEKTEFSPVCRSRHTLPKFTSFGMDLGMAVLECSIFIFALIFPL